jgi:TatD DNase family protein
VDSTSHNKEQGQQGKSHASDVLAYELHGNCYINLTNLCTLRCSFCPKFSKQWNVQGYDLKLSCQPTAAAILQAIGDPGRYQEVVFCGLGEPTMHLSVLLDVADALHGQVRVRLNTDGLGNLVQGMDITPDLAGKVDALSISLNAQSEAVYNRHCRPPQTGTYPALLDFIECAKNHIDDITLTAIDGLEGVDIDACRAIADSYGVKFRQRVLDQVG